MGAPVCCKGGPHGPTRAAGATDLGDSSNYLSDILKDRRGEGFRDNSSCSRVSRSLDPGGNLARTVVCPVGPGPDTWGKRLC